MSKSCFYADDNEKFIPSFCGTSNNSCETPLKTFDYQFSCEDQIVPSSEQNTLGEEATIEVSLEQQATSLKEQINTDDNFNLIEKKNKEKEKLYKERQRKSKNLENIIKIISSPIKKGVLKNLIQENSRTVDEILTYHTVLLSMKPECIKHC